MKQKLLVLTHSSRKVDYNRCSINFLTRRYADVDRLKKVPEFKTLVKAPDASYYAGSISFFKIYIDNDNKINNVIDIGSLKSLYKIQHVLQIDDYRLLICYESFLELWRFDKPLSAARKSNDLIYEVVKKYDHPHFAGLHTVFSNNNNQVIISASAPDSVIIMDIETGEVISEIRMPSEIYGENYLLTDEMDLRKHFIINDYQTTHINCAYPTSNDENIIVSTLIQGAIGIFKLEDKSYKEITRGFIGCHGVRYSEDGEIYFVDSVTGTLIFLNSNGQIVKRFGTGSFWLHDAIQVHDSVYAFSIADRNELILFNIDSYDTIYKKKFKVMPNIFWSISDRFHKYFNLPINKMMLGNSTQFLNIYSY